MEWANLIGSAIGFAISPVTLIQNRLIMAIVLGVRGLVLLARGLGAVAAG